METQNSQIEPLYENSDDKKDFEETLHMHNNFVNDATKYFEDAGVDTEDEGLYEYFDLDLYPYEEFENGMPPADKLKYGGDFPFDSDFKVFYLNIKYASLADRLSVYRLLDRFNINFYPIYIIDNRRLRSYMILEKADDEVQNLLDGYKSNEIPVSEFYSILSHKRKEDFPQKEVKTWILDEDEDDILSFDTSSWVYFGDNYGYKIEVFNKYEHGNK